MTEMERLEDLRELFLSAPESAVAQTLAIVLSLGLVGLVLWLVRRRTLRAEYTPIWVAVALGLFVVSMDLDLLRLFARALGAWTIASTLFFLGEFFLLAICLNYAVRLSQMGVQIRTMAQEIALLNARLDATRDPGMQSASGSGSEGASP